MISPVDETPRCGRPLQYYQVRRGREFDDPDPVCGLPEGHPGYPGRCMSEEVYARQLAASVVARQATPEARRRYRERYAGRAGDRRARYAELRAAGKSRAEARKLSRRTAGQGRLTIAATAGEGAAR